MSIARETDMKTDRAIGAHGVGRSLSDRHRRDIRATGDVLTMEVTEYSWPEGRTETEYVSTDGVVWATTEPGSTRDTSDPVTVRPGSIESGVAETHFGYVDFDTWSDSDDNRVRIWISQDGGEWREIDVPPRSTTTRSASSEGPPSALPANSSTSVSQPTTPSFGSEVSNDG